MRRTQLDKNGKKVKKSNGILHRMMKDKKRVSLLMELLDKIYF